MRAVHWFRNDLRLHDNAALSAASRRASELVPLFVLDPYLLERVHASPTRKRFLLECLRELAADLEKRGCPLVIRRGDPVVEVPRLLGESGAELLTFNRDYSPYARRRDAAVRAKAGVAVEDYKDRVVFESGELRTGAGGAFVVYTPYRNAWEAALREERAPALRLPRGVAGIRSERFPIDDHIGASGDGADLPPGGQAAARKRLKTFVARPIADYARDRDRPAVDGTSRLSPYLRFGAISIRECVRQARAAAEDSRAVAAGARKWIDELVWRDFYAAILSEHPRVLRQPFKRELSRVRWNDDEAGFRAWCDGGTGYPIVDAGMRQLRQTGWMHNRVRMIVASFLCKDLLIDWRRGERHFMRWLADGDPASNDGGWQWAASTGTDPQPYFRIFNPTLQGERYDPDGAYVRRFVPELRDVPARWIHKPWQAPDRQRDYRPPIVDHAERRVLAVARYEAARNDALKAARPRT